MPVRTEDYRRYGREYEGRGYRIFRIYSNNFRSMIGNKWSIIVISLSFLFLFFSILEVVFSAPVEEIQNEITEELFSEKFIAIVPVDEGDLNVVAGLGSTFEVSYDITNVGKNSTTPMIMVMLPNELWEADWDLFIGELGPGDSKRMDVVVSVPSTWEDFSYVPDIYREDEGPVDEEPQEKPAPRSVGQSFDIDDIGSFPIPDIGGMDLGSISSPYSFFRDSQIFAEDISRMMMVFVIPDDVNLSSMLEGKEVTLDPRISSVASIVSIDPKDCGIEPAKLDQAGTPSLEIKVEDSKNGVRWMKMRSQDYKEFRVTVRNIGSAPIHLRFETLLMPFYDPAWYVDFWTEYEFADVRPFEELAPGERWEYHVTVSSGYLSMEMPYNILVLVTETSDPDYDHALAQQVVVDITGPPKVLSLEEKLFDTFWGGGFNYAKFLWIVLLTAVCGSGLIANDLKNNTFTLYFSRPITWYDYMVGKFLALASILSIITLVPAVIIFLTRMTFINEPFIYILEHLWLLGGMLLGYIIAIVIFTSIAMALSSMTKRGIFTGVGIFGSFILTSIVSDIMVEIFDTDIVKVININLMMKNLVKPLFGISYSSNSMGFGYGLVVLVCLLIIAASWAIIFYRFNNKEVAR